MTAGCAGNGQVNAFIYKWLGVMGGAERAKYQLFLTEFALALDLPATGPGQGGARWAIIGLAGA